MSVLFVPSEAGGWRFHLTVLLLMLVPTMAVAQLGAADDLPRVAALQSVVVAAGLSVATVSLYVHHRVTGLAQSGWVCVAIGVGAVPTLGFGLFAWTHTGSIPEPLAPLLGYRLVLMVLVLGCLWLARRSRMPVDSLALGLGIGLVVSVARQLSVQAVGPADPRPPSVAFECVLLALVTMVIGLPLLGIVALPVWLRARSFVALGLLGASAALEPLVVRAPAAAVAALVAAVAGSVLVATTSVAYAHLALIARGRELSALEDELARIESGHRADRLRLREIDSTVAGIASASRLMQAGSDLSEGRREVLAGMVAAEVARLQRLTHRRQVEESGSVPLPEVRQAGRAAVDGGPALSTVAIDDVVGRMALMHRARGCRIEWTVSGLRVHAAEDQVAEIMDALLHNAARHGSPEHIAVLTQRVDGDVVVTVVDEGPGVPDGRQAHLFDGPGDPMLSGAAGIALPVARARARAMGGDLWLAESAVGARFVLRLTAVDDQVSVDLGASGPSPAVVPIIRRTSVR